MVVVFTRSSGWRRWHWHLTDDILGVNAGSVTRFRMRFFCERNFRKYYQRMAAKRSYWPPIVEVDVKETHR